jgi:hypothetical protein
MLVKGGIKSAFFPIFAFVQPLARHFKLLAWICSPYKGKSEENSIQAL